MKNQMGWLAAMVLTCMSCAGRPKSELLPLEASHLMFQMPAQWQREDPSSQMRKAQVRLPGEDSGAQLVVYYFGGAGGSVEANLERWIAQMEQPDGSDSGDHATTRTLTLGGMNATTLDLTGTFVARVSPGQPEV